MQKVKLPILRVSYKKIEHPALPAKPGQIPIFEGRNPQKSPQRLEQYLKGGYRYSEQRKREIHSQLFARSIIRSISHNVIETSILARFLRSHYC